MSATRLWGLNESGEMVGSSFDGASSSSFLYNGGTFTTLNIPGVDNLSVAAINDSGEIVRGVGSGTATGGFLYSGGVLTPINVPGAEYTVAKGINDYGQIVGSYAPPSSYARTGYGDLARLGYDGPYWKAAPQKPST